MSEMTKVSEHEVQRYFGESFKVGDTVYQFNIPAKTREEARVKVLRDLRAIVDFINEDIILEESYGTSTVRATGK